MTNAVGTDRPKSNTPIFVIAGPTASGKTAVALHVARELGAEIVGADSMQVYRHLNIGTDTPTPEQLGDVRHHMLDMVDPDQPYDVASFSRDADEAISEISARGRRVLLVGGTGLYIRVLLRGLQAGPPPSPDIREEICSRARRLGWPSLHEELREVDPTSAQKLHPNDGVRILRALEVHRQSGIPMSEWQQRHRFSSPRYPSMTVALDRPREDLAKRIAVRVEEMVGRGFVAEVENLLKKGYPPDLKPMQGLGYRRICEHLAGVSSLGEAIDQIASDTRKLAKRQRTWFNGDPDLEWVAPDSEEMAARARRFFEAHEGTG